MTTTHTTTTQLDELRGLFAESELHLHVIDWLEGRAEDYDNDLIAVLEDVLNAGCVSGIVSELIYYADTNAFYDKFVNELWEIASEFDSEPLRFFSTLNGADDVSDDTQFKNLVAWWGFETAAYNIHASLEQI